MQFKNLSLLLAVAALAKGESNSQNPIGPTKSINGKPFAGLTYNPNRATADCQPPENIKEDLEILSKYTKSIRTYALGCEGQDKEILKNAAALGMDVTFGLWVDQWETFDIQFALLKELLDETTAKDHASIKALVVGNEAVFRGEISTKGLAAHIAEVRAYLKSKGLSQIKLTTAEINVDYDETLIDAVDFLLPNLHVFFDDFTAETAPGNYFHKLKLMAKLTDKPIVVGEVGWPSAGDPFDFDNRPSKSVPGVENAKFIMNSLLCEANRLGLDYFYFDSFNADWKFGSPNSEFNWGIGTSDRKIKDYIADALVCNEKSYEFKRVLTCDGAVYDDKIFNCTDNLFLCPNPLVACGKKVGEFSCYDNTKLSCKNGELGPL